MTSNTPLSVLTFVSLAMVAACHHSKPQENQAPIENSTRVFNTVNQFAGEAGFKHVLLNWTRSDPSQTLPVRIFRSETGRSDRQQIYEGEDSHFDDTYLDFEKEYIYQLETKSLDDTWATFPTSLTLKPQFSISGTALLRVSDLQPSDQLGTNAVAIAGDTMVVGSPNEDGGPGNPKPNSGSVYIFKKRSQLWEEVQILRPSTLLPLETFGLTVAIENDLIAVSSQYKENNKIVGGTYTFRNINGTWTFEQLLLAGDRAQGDAFGTSLKIQGGQVIVGSPGSDIPGPNGKQNIGAVYVFEKVGATWEEVQKIAAPRPLDDLAFGNALSASGKTLVIGSPFSTGGINHDIAPAGCTYIFEKNTLGMWEYSSEVFGSDVEFADGFGYAVSIEGERILVGAPSDDGPTPQASITEDTGAVYVFEKNNGVWSQTSLLRQSSPIKDNKFGWFLTLSKDLIIVSTPFDDIQGVNDAGSVSFYAKGVNGWGLQENLVSTQSKALDRLGYAVAISGNTIVVGSPGYDAIGAGNEDTGAVFIYEVR